MWFLGGILNNSTALCHTGCKHNIDRGTYRYHIEINMIAHQCIGKGIDHTVLDIDRGTQGTKAFQMLVDRTASDITAAGKSNLSLFIFAKKST